MKYLFLLLLSGCLQTEACKNADGKIVALNNKKYYLKCNLGNTAMMQEVKE